ncbi:MAG: hypothetical protein AAF417_20760 [Pseudomonadota bacterium]
MTEENTNKSPTHIAYNVRQSGDESYWDRIGVAWAHSDGQGFNVELSAMPVDGRIAIRTRKEKAPAQ